MAKNKAVKRDKITDKEDEATAKAAEAALTLAKKTVEKKYGEVVSVLAEHGDMVIPTISTGCMSLDIALGCGGMGLGRVYELFGPAGSGKSTLAVNVIIQAQRRGMKCLYIDAEHAVDPKLFKDYGVDTDRLEIAQAYDGESNLEILEVFARTGAFSVIVVDSVAALIPRDEAEADIDKDGVGLHARLMGKALRKITPIANQTQTLIIFINQERMKIGGYGNPKTTTGGEALAFYATGRIAVKGPEARSRRIANDKGEVIGHNSEFEVVKNKLAAPFKTAYIDLIYGKGYDAVSEVLAMATSLGVVDKKGAWYSYKGENFANGALKAVEYLRDPVNEDMFEEIKDAVMNMVGLEEVYERHGHKGPIFTREDIPAEAA